MGRDHLVVRGLIVAAQLCVVNFWLVRHLGHGLDGFVALTGAVTLITGVFSLMAWMSTDDQTKTTARNIRKLLVGVFSFPLLAISGAALLTLLLVTSSVVVVNDFGEARPKVVLTRADRGQMVASDVAYSSNPPKTLDESIKDAGCATAQPAAGEAAQASTAPYSDDSVLELDRSKDDPYRFFVTTSPLGRPYLLRVKGYLPKPLEVYPLGGVTIIPSRDLRPAPSILLRPDPDALADLSDGGYIIVTRLRNGNKQLLACKAKTRSSFLIGSMEFLPATIPQKLREDWRLELTQAGEDEQHTAQTLIEWGNAQRLPLLGVGDLESRMRLEIEIRSRRGLTIARSFVTLRDDELTDVSIPYIKKKPAAPSSPSGSQ